MSGWIKLHRSLLDWEWYSKPVVRSVFIHCLLRANHKENKWRGKIINRGEFISSLGKLSAETGFTVQQIRTAIKHLKSTGEVTSSGSAQHTVFKVNNYDLYQDLTSETTNNQQAINKRSTTNKNEKNEKNVRSNIYTVDFESCWSVYPKREGSNPKNKAYQSWNARIKEGESVDSMMQGARRYALFCQQKGQINTSYVMQASRFFGTEKNYQNDWSVNHEASKSNVSESLVERVARKNGLNPDFTPIKERCSETVDFIDANVWNQVD